MCRSADFHHHHFRAASASPDRDRLILRAFHVRFSGPKPPGQFPDSLTLLFLPLRGSGCLLEVDGSKIRLDSPAFLTLHRVVTAAAEKGAVVYGSRDRVRAGPGLRFEVYVGEEKALKGAFRKDGHGDRDSEGQGWKLECACALERGMAAAGADVEASWMAEVCVSLEGHVALFERVEMKRRRTRRRKGFECGELEEIPEEMDVESESDGCCCSCESGSEGWVEEEVVEGEDWEVDTEAVRWAVDVGIWVVCLGVGYFLSKASARRLRRGRLV